ncbi:MAG: hypothetical protein HYY31_01060 [Chloroflexi bacterium]|nr:hypothetical protein [Chloroflexota bacterium]
MRVESANGGGAIGKLYLLPLPSDHTLLQIPLGRGSTTPARSYNHDPNGQIFSKYLEAVLQEMARLGFITARGRFSSVSVLESAKQALASARDATGYASVGNSCRLALIGLANEIYDPSMGPADAPELKGDDGKGKLRRAAAHYGATLAERQYDAFARIVESAWDFAAPLPHRKHAERKHAEVCVALVTTIFDCFALMVPDAGSR